MYSWTQHEPTRRWLHRRLNDITRQYAMPCDYDVIKAQVWPVAHLEELTCTPEEALAQVERWCQQKLAESGAEQLPLL